MSEKTAAELQDRIDVINAKFARADAHYAAIGRVAEGWAALEFLTDTICWALAGIDNEVGGCLTSQVTGMARKADALISLAKLREVDAALIKRTVKFYERARGLGEIRNRVVHDPWLIFDTEPKRLQVSARRKLVIEHVLMSTDEVLKIYKDIDGLWDELAAIHDAMGQWFPSNFPRTIP